MSTAEVNRLLAEFALERYASVDALNIVQWCNELVWRDLLMSWIREGPGEDQEIFANVLVDHLCDPVRRRHDRVMHTGNVRAVADMTLGDMAIHATHAYRVAGLAEALQKQRELPPDSEEVPSLLFESYHSRLLELEVPDPLKARAPVMVNLQAADEQITEQFQTWLAQKRLDQSSTEVKAPLYHRFDESVFKAWVKWRLLPEVDLQLIEESSGQKIKYKDRAKLLFPEDPDPEKVRKTVKVHAGRAMETSSILALTFAAMAKLGGKN